MKSWKEIERIIGAAGVQSADLHAVMPPQAKRSLHHDAVADIYDRVLDLGVHWPRNLWPTGNSNLVISKGRRAGLNTLYLQDKPVFFCCRLPRHERHGSYHVCGCNLM